MKRVRPAAPRPAKYQTVGTAQERIDGEDKVSGRAFFTADRSLRNMAWGKVLRSPFAHARITRIDATRARNVPGVLAVLTAADVSPNLFGRQLRDMPVLAQDRVRFAGEKVAAVAAESPDIAEYAANLVEVEYEQIPAVLSSLEAIAEGAPIIHEKLATYPCAPVPVPSFPNTHSHVTWTQGDCRRGLEESDFTFEQTFTTQRSHQGYLEPHACVVALGPRDRISVWSSNKVPFQCRQYLCEVLGIEPERILFHLSPVGGDFGGKGTVMDLPLAYHLARASGRPVKMVMTYSEELTAGNPRHPAIINIKTGVKRSGKLCARSVRIIFDSGAYAAFKPNATMNLPGARHAVGAYSVPNLFIEALSIYTNRVPSGFMRGPGSPQVYFAVEAHTDFIARELRIDPLEFRRINVAGRGDLLPTGHPVETDAGKKLLESVRKISKPSAENGGAKIGKKLRGTGMALGLRDLGLGEANVEVGLKPDGSAYLLTTVVDTGAGAHTTLRQIVAETLGVAAHDVDIRVGDTDSFNTDIALGGSRVNYMAGNAAALAALRLQSRIKEIASRRWRCAPGSIGIKDRMLLGPEKHRVSLSVLAGERAAAGMPLKEVGHFEATDRKGTLSFFAQVAEVEIDVETGRLTILKMTSVNDVGIIINPLVHQAQVEGGLIQGLGYAVMEHLQDDAGKIITANLGDYKIPAIRDIPRLQTVNIYDATGMGPFQSKPIGENTISPTAAAIANAVYDAMGIQVHDLPITSEKIYFALKRGAA